MTLDVVDLRVVVSSAADLDDVYIELVPLSIVRFSVVGSVLVVGAIMVSFSVFTSVEQSNLVMAHYDNLKYGYQSIFYLCNV